MMEGLPPVVSWPPLQTLMRLTLALAVGLFVGLEREWRGKEAGLRTFGFAALLGGMGGLLAILAFAICPVLPSQLVDPWGLIEPRAAWVTVILIAAIGFVNYLLWKVFGAHGVEVTGFLGGIVNSTVTVAELAHRVRETSGRLLNVAYRGVMLATAAMALRNAVLLGLLSFRALVNSAIPRVLILLSSTGLAGAFVQTHLPTLLP